MSKTKFEVGQLVWITPFYGDNPIVWEIPIVKIEYPNSDCPLFILGNKDIVIRRAESFVYETKQGALCGLREMAVEELDLAMEKSAAKRAILNSIDSQLDELVQCGEHEND